MPAGRGKRWQLNLFSFCVTAISHVLLLRDRLRGVPRKLKKPVGGEEFLFASGGRRLAAVLVAAGERSPVVLLCHGIAETVEHWSAVQSLLEERGVGSMVFNYSGYGKSEGTIRAEHCDEDFVSAYAELRRQVGAERRVFVLGFSMGSGIAASGVGGLKPAPEGLFLCEAFTTFREATRAAGVPGSWCSLRRISGIRWRRRGTCRSRCAWCTATGMGCFRWIWRGGLRRLRASRGSWWWCMGWGTMSRICGRRGSIGARWWSG